MIPERIVLDNSVVMAWCFEDELCDYANTVIRHLRVSEAIAPAVWPLEVGNALLSAERRGRVTESDSIRFLNLINGLSISVEQESPQRMLSEIVILARERKLSTYDASYLDLAARTGLPLATLDQSLAKAARACGIRLFSDKNTSKKS